MSSSETASNIEPTLVAKKERKFGSVLSLNTPAQLLTPKRLAKDRQSFHHTTGSLKKRGTSRCDGSFQLKACKSVDTGKENATERTKAANDDKKIKVEKASTKIQQTIEPKIIGEAELDAKIDAYLKGSDPAMVHKWLTSAELDPKEPSTINYHVHRIISRYRALQATNKENEQLKADIAMLREKNDLLSKQIEQINQIKTLLELDEA